ncbi:MAG TPA: two-component system VirA-like sensor kinase [Dongiaceae bacterium]|nr:two-component system VirA-like sensor kinase [Dongiaceae bacterium]
MKIRAVKVMPTAASIPVLIILLTWLLIKGMNTNSQQFELAIGALDDFQMMESALLRDVLAARAGELRNYDPLVREVNGLHDSLEQLRVFVGTDMPSITAFNRLGVLIDRRERLAEQFKTSNALLQNSLAYFGLFSTRLGASGEQGTLVPAVSSLASAMLHFTLNTSPEVADRVNERLDDLARLPVSPADADAVETLLAHGRLLHDLLPATDAIVRELFAVPSRPEEDILRTNIIARHNEARHVAREYRLMLYLTSILLLVILLHLGLRLRSRARTLQRHAELEHLIAGISTGFIDCEPHAIDDHIEAALAQLAAFMNVDRAYFVISGRYPRSYVWCREGAPFPDHWPIDTLNLSAEFDMSLDGVIRVCAVSALPAGPGRQRLEEAGLISWICVARIADGDIHSLLGFDCLVPQLARPFATAPRSEELGLLRMALDAISHAVDRASLEQERARLEARLEQARRLETVGSFASGIAHNFNNIVGAILGYAEIAEARIAAPDQVSGCVEEIRRAGERARDLVEQILAFGRHRDGHRRPISVDQLLTETASLLEASLPRTVELMLGKVPEQITVLGEPTQLQQVVLNLCNNAAQAMDNSGSVAIDVELHDIPWAQSLSHGELTKGHYVSVCVTDKGCGISPSTLARLFEPFFTTKTTGNGLGLATVREIVRQHGGAMNVMSSPGAGSRFEAWLPCVGGEMMPQLRLPFLPTGNGETVLLVGDDRAQVLADEEMLAALGYEPVGITSEAELMSACRDAPARFDCLILGQFSTMSAATEMARKAHKIAPALPILLTTVSIQTVDTKLLLTAGICEVVRRPMISVELASAVKRCLQGNRSLPQLYPS